MKTLENSSDTLVDALYTNDLVVKLQRNGSREKQFQSKSNTDGKNSDGKKSCVWCKEDVHSVTSPQLTMKFVNSMTSRNIFNRHAPRRTHKDNNFKHQKLSTLDVLSQRKVSNPVQSRCKESQCLLRYPPSKTCKAYLRQWILFVYVYLQFDQENASHAQSAETRHTFCMDQWHAERTKHFQGRHRQFS